MNRNYNSDNNWKQKKIINFEKENKKTLRKDKEFWSDLRKKVINDKLKPSDYQDIQKLFTKNYPNIEDGKGFSKKDNNKRWR